MEKKIWNREITFVLSLGPLKNPLSSWTLNNLSTFLSLFLLTNPYNREFWMLMIMIVFHKSYKSLHFHFFFSNDLFSSSTFPVLIEQSGFEILPYNFPFIDSSAPEFIWLWFLYLQWNPLCSRVIFQIVLSVLL